MFVVVLNSFINNLLITVINNVDCAAMIEFEDFFLRPQKQIGIFYVVK